MRRIRKADGMRRRSRVFIQFCFLIALSAMATTHASAGEDCITFFGRIVHSEKVTTQDLLRLRREMKQPVKTIKALAISANDIHSISKVHKGGAFASIAIEVDTPQGTRFLKIYDDSKLNSLAYTHVIQNAMARKGMAPMISGYLAPDEVKKLIAKFPALKSVLSPENRSASYGILMDRVEIAAAISKHHSPPLPAEWTKVTLENRILEVENAMSDLRLIPPGDLQAAVDRQGRFLLYDFDGYGHVTEGDQVFHSESQRGQYSLEDFMERTYRHDLDWAEQEPSDVFRVGARDRFRVRLSALRHSLGLDP